MSVKTTPFDSAAYLRNEKDMAEYLNACLEENDPALLAHAVGVIARARGMTQLAKDAHLSRESLYKALATPALPR